MTIADIGVILAGWALMLWVPLLRTTRTVAFLVLMTTFFVGAGLTLSSAMASILRIVLIGGYVLVFLQGRWWLVGLSRVDGQLDARLRRVAREVSRAHDQWFRSYDRGDMEAARAAGVTTAGACDAAVAELDGLKSDSAEWKNTIQLLREYFLALRATAAGPVGQASEAEGRPGQGALDDLNRRAITAWQHAVDRAKM